LYFTGWSGRGDETTTTFESVAGTDVAVAVATADVVVRFEAVPVFDATGKFVDAVGGNDFSSTLSACRDGICLNSE
jgi:hypothetical protein